jgi:hypothetical protein
MAFEVQSLLNFMKLCPYWEQRSRFHAPRVGRIFALQETNMLGSIARWTHNVLLTASGLLTLAFLVTAK